MHPRISIAAVIALGVVAGLVALVINRRTRVLGLVLLAVLVVLPVFMFHVRTGTTERSRRAVAQHGIRSVEQDDNTVISHGPHAEVRATRPGVEVESGPAPGWVDRVWARAAHEHVAVGYLAVVVGLMMGLAVLLANPRTRAATLAVMGVGVAMLALILPASLWYMTLSRPTGMVKVPAMPTTVESVPLESKSTAAEIGYANAVLVESVLLESKSTASKPAAAAKRPAWVDAPAQYVENAYTMPVTIGPYTTPLECEAKLPETLQSALAEYVDLYLGSAAAQSVRLPDDEVRQLVKERWQETVDTSVGKMAQLHARLAIDTKMQERLKDEWRSVQVAGRLRWTAAALAGVLLLLAVTYGLLASRQATIRLSLSKTGDNYPAGQPNAALVEQPAIGSQVVMEGANPVASAGGSASVRSAAFVIGMIQAALWALLGIVLTWQIAVCELLFKQFGTTLPAITIAILGLGPFLLRFWYYFLLPICAWPWINRAVVSRLSQSPAVVLPRRLWHCLTWLALIIAVGILTLGLYLPFVSLVQNLSLRAH
jgi:hypothetical protein